MRLHVFKAMTFFQDLTPYQYFLRHEPVGLTPVNVGWLGYGRPFTQGQTSQEFKDRLLGFCSDKYVVHIARGFHVCELCDVTLDQWYDEDKDDHSKYGAGTEWMSIGDGEIRVIGEAGIYAAPTLIYHYVIEHGYQPPDEFIEAVLKGSGPGSEEHQALLAKYRHV